MKLLYVTEDRFPPFRADVVELFAHQLVQRGHRIDWMMRRSPEALTEPPVLDWRGSTVYLSPRLARRGLLGRASRLLNPLLSLWGDLRLLDRAWRGGYDVIQVRDRYAVAVWAWIAARLTGARFTFWMSYPYAESKQDQARNGFVPNPGLTRLKGRAIGWLLYRVVLPRADHVFVQSERMRDDVAAQGIDPARMTPVPMGIRDDQVGQASDARAPDPAAPVLLYLGILLRLRQTEMLVRVLARVRQQHPGARLRYVGEGVHPSDRQAIVDEAARLGLSDAVEITGFLPMAEAWTHVRAADICLSPFYPIPVLLSTSPTKLIEYMAMAKCVVANEHPEQSRILADSGMGAAVPWDEAAFADAVNALLADPEAARRRAALGPDWVRAHRTYGVIADRVDAVYRNVVLAPRPVT
jgi:glycosyltransferase involved in cell wall biosynthesis